MKRLNANAAIAAKVELVSHFYVTVPEIIFIYANGYWALLATQTVISAA